MTKYYAVKKGKRTGVFTSWSECEEQIKGYSGAIYKKFSDKEEAEKFVELSSAESNSDLKNTDEVEINIDSKDVLYAYVDGSYSDNIAGYGLVLVKNDEVLLKDLGTFKNLDMLESRNVFGEIRGALKAVELAIANDFKKITIVYDYMGIACWANGEWKAHKAMTQDYRDFMQKYMKEIDISFLKVKAHSGDKYNDMADLLAKKAVGIK